VAVLGVAAARGGGGTSVGAVGDAGTAVGHGGGAGTVVGAAGMAGVAGGGVAGVVRVQASSMSAATPASGVVRRLPRIPCASNAIHTSQLALPKAVCDVVYATTGYEQSVRNLSQVTLASDSALGDGSDLQVATVTGDVMSGYTTTLTVGIDPAGRNSGGGTAPGTDGAPTGAPPPGAPPSGAPPSGAPQPSGSPSPAAAPGLPNTGGGGTSGPASWTSAAPIAALAALLVPLVRRGAGFRQGSGAGRTDRARPATPRPVSPRLFARSVAAMRLMRNGASGVERRRRGGGRGA
jgi:hypothetical protein